MDRLLRNPQFSNFRRVLQEQPVPVRLPKEHRSLVHVGVRFRND